MRNTEHQPLHYVIHIAQELSWRGVKRQQPRVIALAFCLGSTPGKNKVRRHSLEGITLCRQGEVHPLPAE